MTLFTSLFTVKILSQKKALNKSEKSWFLAFNAVKYILLPKTLKVRDADVMLAITAVDAFTHMWISRLCREHWERVEKDFNPNKFLVFSVRWYLTPSLTQVYYTTDYKMDVITFNRFEAIKLLERVRQEFEEKKRNQEIYDFVIDQYF